jgi:hypothetical protein
MPGAQVANTHHEPRNKPRKQMSDSFKGLVVTFDQDVTEEYLKAVTDALGLFHGVISVRPLVANFDSIMSDDRAKWALRTKIMELWK